MDFAVSMSWLESISSTMERISRFRNHFAVDEIEHCGELFVVGETLEQIASFIIRNCGEYFISVEVISSTKICVQQRG